MAKNFRRLYAGIPDLFSDATYRRRDLCADLAYGSLGGPAGYLLCNRRKKHHGRHAVGNGELVLATWE